MTAPDQGLFDVHAHFSPPTSARARQAMWEASRRQQFHAPGPFEWTLQETLAYMDETGTAMQLLSNVPTDPDRLRASNDYGLAIVRQHPARFGLLAAVPTSDPDAGLSEIGRLRSDADGWAMQTDYAGHSLASPTLEPLWLELNAMHAVVFVHPNAYAPAAAGMPTPLIEVAFDTARTIIAMLYNGVFTRHPEITFIIAHCGGALPLLAGRLSLLGAEPWVPNPHRLTRTDIAHTLRRLWLDTAASASLQQLTAAAQTVGAEHLVYGSDWGAACTNHESAWRNIRALRQSGLSAPTDDGLRVDTRGASLFPRADSRLRTRRQP